MFSQTVKNFFKRFAEDETGATAIEYGLFAALISVVIIIAVTAIGNSLNVVFTAISNSLNNVAASIGGGS